MRHSLNEYGTAVAVVGVTAVICLGSSGYAPGALPVFPARDHAQAVQQRQRDVAQILSQLSDASRTAGKARDTSHSTGCKAIVTSNLIRDPNALVRRSPHMYVTSASLAYMPAHLLNLPPPVRP